MRCLVSLCQVIAVLQLTCCSDFALVGIAPQDAAPAADAAPSSDATTPDAPAAVSDAAPARDDATSAPLAQTRIDECDTSNPAGLTPSEVATLMNAPNLDSTQRYLYPYADTVFPGGMRPPEVMWEGPAASAVLLRLRNSRFEYIGCLEPTGEHRLLIPETAWRAAGAMSNEPLELQLTTFADGRATGPISRQLQIASAPFRGSVYYMTYGPSNLAAIMRASATRPTQLLFGGLGCIGCHTLSANGTRLLAFSQGFSVPFDIAANTTDTPASVPVLQVSGGEFAGLSPDGSVYVAPAHPGSGIGTRSLAAVELQAGLFETTTGVRISDSGIPELAMTPAFSSDGSLLAFNDGGHDLALMDFSRSQRRVNGYRTLLHDAEAFPAWPSFLPDRRALLFALGQSGDFSGNGAHLMGNTTTGPQSDVYSLDLASGHSTLLARAMGYLSGDTSSGTDLPFGALDQRQNYYPSVSPIASGGYVWLFFDSVRNYGNRGVSRQIWGAAIDSAAADYDSDRSHPPFYLPGQDPSASNLRPVAVLDPCHPDTSSCSTAIECCSGSCTQAVCDRATTPNCAATAGLCETDLDCCDRTQQCVSGSCGSLPKG